MRTMLLRLATAAVRGWTRAYTRGLPAPLRDARRQEVASDLFESERDPDGQGWSLPFQIITRLLIGIVDDIQWRFEKLETEYGRARRRVAMAITAGVLMLPIVMVVIASRPAPLPQLPELQLHERLMLKRAPPPLPPPPPPPPPCGPRGVAGPQTDCTR